MTVQEPEKAFGGVFVVPESLIIMNLYEIIR